MTDDTTLFTAGEQTTTQSTTTPNTGNPDQGNKAIDVDVVFADQLAAIKNDQGAPKYSTVNDALHALKSAQSHIKTLEDENSDYKTKVTSDNNMQTILDALKSNKDELASQTSETQIGVQDLEGTTMEVIQKYEAQKEADRNQQEVTSMLVEKFGDKAKEMYIKKANDLGLSAKDLDTLSARSPNAVFEFFKEADKVAFNTNVESSVNTSALGSASTTSPQKFDGLMYGAKEGALKSAWQQSAEQVNNQYKT